MTGDDCECNCFRALLLCLDDDSALFFTGVERVDADVSDIPRPKNFFLRLPSCTFVGVELKESARCSHFPTLDFRLTEVSGEVLVGFKSRKNNSLVRILRLAKNRLRRWRAHTQRRVESTG